MLEGIIIKGISGFYYVESGNEIYECKARGIFRKKNRTPLVGDRVLIEVVDETSKKGVIEEIRPRKNRLIRPPVANIDKVFVVFAVKEPSPNRVLLDKFLVFSEKENLQIAILLTKIDLDTDGSITEKLYKDYTDIGYRVIPVSAKTGENIEMLRTEIEGSISAFAGQSGVGKSSLLNALEPGFNLETDIISQKLGRGKHTTRHAELFKLGNGLIADTPGFSSYELEDIDPEELKEYFIEFSKYDDCRFQGKCIHKNEPECGVKEAVEKGLISKERYSSYIQLLEQIQNNKKRR